MGRALSGDQASWRPISIPARARDRLSRPQCREIRELGYVDAYTAVKRYLAAIRPQNGPPTRCAPRHSQASGRKWILPRFVVDFTDDPGASQIAWLFSLMLGHSHFMFAR